MLTTSFIIGCSAEVPVTPEPAVARDGTALARGGHACTAHPTAIVTDEASLHAAMAAAQPGDVVAIRGSIEVVNGVHMNAGVTLTCAEPGARLAIAPVTEETELIYAASNTTVRGLVLDARSIGDPLYAESTVGQRFEQNTILCGGSCGFWPLSSNSIVTDNDATANGAAGTGFHFQSGIDGTRIERNTMTATEPTASGPFGAIRARDGVDVSIQDNVIVGPWSISISTVNLADSRIARNDMMGAQRYGVTYNLNQGVLFSTNNIAIGNRVRDAGIGGYFVQNACYNSFNGNKVEGTTPLAFTFRPTTGANVVVGTSGTSIDDGSYDCDGDGSPDPNRVSGTVITTSTAALTASAGVSSLRDREPRTPRGRRVVPQ